MAIGGSITDFRIDHNKIVGYSSASSFGTGKKYGVFDHNRIEDCSGECLYVIGDGNQSWTDGGSGGGYTDGTVYFEDNVFDLVSGSGSNIIDSGEGARWVFRYNTVNETNGFYGVILASHGHFWGERDGPNNAGTYLQEIYENTFNSGADRDWGNVSRSRGGRVFFYNNNFTGPFWNNAGSITLWNKESSASGGTCTVAAHDTLFASHGASWDGTCFSNDEHPCPAQTNNTYIWGNPSGFSVFIDDGNYAHIEEDRDYWDDVGGGDINFSIGSSRPGNCTPDDVYWESVDRELYRCTATDVWTLVYEPYHYPHPLTNQSSPPSNLRKVPN